MDIFNQENRDNINIEKDVNESATSIELSANQSSGSTSETAGTVLNRSADADAGSGLGDDLLRNNIEGSNVVQTEVVDDRTEKKAKREKKKGRGLMKFVAVAVASSVLGGGIVAAFFTFALPRIEPSVVGYLQSRFPSDSSTSGNSTGNIYKNIADTSNQIEEGVVTRVAEQVGPSVVGIKVTSGSQQIDAFSFYFGGGSTQSTSEGSGIIISTDGYIVTNSHVIENALDNTGQVNKKAKIEIYLPGQTDKPYTAELVGRDSKTDLAVLKINASDLPAAKFGNSDLVKVGELAVAIGNPGGLEYMGSVTAGIISGLNRTVKTEDGKDLTYIQTDAAINPGNSGGALVNAAGEVIGINTIKVAATGFEGLGFAIPSNKVKEITDSLIKYKYVKGRPLLGIQAESRYTEAIAKKYGWPMGVYVADVTPFTGAYSAGIKQGDIITKFDGTEIKSFDELKTAINKHKPGDVVDVEIYRDGEYKTLKVTITEDKS